MPLEPIVGRMVHDDLQRIGKGWRVLGRDGRAIGEVEQVRDDLLVVHRGRLLGAQRLYVPIDALAEVGADTVVLGLPASEVGSKGWHVRPTSPPPRGRERARGEEHDMTTMTGAGFGAGGTAASGGPLGPTRGRGIEGRFGGSGRAGLGSPELGEQDEEVVPESMENRTPDQR